LFDRLRLCGGILRSLRIYYGGAQRRRDMTALYAPFVKPGDLAFDLGAHVGDRVAAFRALGCRVVAVEPQPALARLPRPPSSPRRATPRVGANRPGPAP
jgi:hypothetical protein